MGIFISRDNADPAKIIIEEHYAANELSEEENICHFDMGKRKFFRELKSNSFFKGAEDEQK